jgi:hypothetical protein
MKTVKITIEISAEQKADLKAMAKKEGLILSKLYERIFVSGLLNYKTK